MIRIPLVTSERFGEESCLDGFVFGVITACDSCDFKMNSCLRRHLSEALWSNQLLTEKELGYPVTERYHIQDIPWHCVKRQALDFKGVEALNVKQKVTSIGTFDLDPYIATNVTATAGVVVLDSELIENPNLAVIRNPASTSVLEIDESALAYPRRNVGGDWEVKLSNVDITAVDVQHCRYVVLTADLGGETDVVAVETDTERYIPFAKPPVLNEDDTTTMWFYVWSLVDPAFELDDEINLYSNPQFYKLLQEIEIVQLEDEEALPVIIWDDLTTTTEGITVELLFDNKIRITLEPTLQQTCAVKVPLKIRVFYKTNPEILGIDLETIIEAIVYLTAAELPVKSCRCEAPKEGFIYEAQKPYTDIKINPVTGVTYAQLKYGTKHGQMVYKERISKAKDPTKRKAFIL